MINHKGHRDHEGDGMESSLDGGFVAFVPWWFNED